MSPRDKFNLIARFLSKNFADAEPDEKELASPEFSKLQQVWRLTGEVEAPPTPKGQWQRLQAAMHSATSRRSSVLPLPQAKAPQRNRRWSIALRLAAGFLIAVTSYWTMQKLLFQSVTVQTANAEIRNIELPDGSLAELNAGSTITYSKTGRDVTLAGEAFFQVQPGKGKFLVRTDDALVTVLGTGFNVYSREGQVAVVVEHGRVALEGPTQTQRVVIQAGEMSRLQDGQSPTPPEKVDLDKYLAWLHGRLEFERTPLPLVFAELMRQFDIQIQFDLASVSGKTLTASFRTSQDFDEVLSAICLTFGWRYQESDGVFEVMTKR